MEWLKKLFKKKEEKIEPVKEEVKPIVMEEPPAPPAEIVREKQFVVNCPRCGAAVKVSGTASAYLCGACRQIFRVRIEAKMVKDLSAADLNQMEEPAPVEAPMPVEAAPAPVSAPAPVVEEEIIAEENEEIVEEEVEEIVEVVEEIVEEVPAEETTEA